MLLQPQPNNPLLKVEPKAEKEEAEEASEEAVPEVAAEAEVVPKEVAAVETTRTGLPSPSSEDS